MDREELKTDLMKVCNIEGWSSCRDTDCDARCPFYAPMQAILSEFDRLKDENERLTSAIRTEHQIRLNAEDGWRQTLNTNNQLQSWLDRISEPIKEYTKCNINSLPVHESVIESLQAIRDYLDSKQREKVKIKADFHLTPEYVKSVPPDVYPGTPMKYAHKGDLEDCPICNPLGGIIPSCSDSVRGFPKLKLCPECNGAMRIRCCPFTEAGFQGHTKANMDKCTNPIIYKCPTCSGQGVIRGNG